MDTFTFDDVDFEKLLGSGKYAQVFEASRKSDGKSCAAKIYKERKAFTIEWDVLKKVAQHNLSGCVKIFHASFSNQFPVIFMVRWC